MSTKNQMARTPMNHCKIQQVPLFEIVLFLLKLRMKQQQDRMFLKLETLLLIVLFIH